jgi:uncharacterized membrane protein
MKMPINWHRQCLQNAQKNLALEEIAMQKRIAALETLRSRALDYEAQVSEAVRRGMDGFDADRFLQRRKEVKT